MSLTTMATKYLFTEPHASDLAKLRIKARQKHRIIYDCLNAIVDGDKVKCNKGNRLGRAPDGSMGLTSALSGRTALVCQDCKDYDADEVTARIIGDRVYD